MRPAIMKILGLSIMFITACFLVWVISGVPSNAIDDVGIDDDGFYILDGAELEEEIEVPTPEEEKETVEIAKEKVTELFESIPETNNDVSSSCDVFHEVFNGEEYNIPTSSQLGLSTHPVMVFSPDELTLEILENRNGAVVIEMLISRIDSVETGDGTVLNTSDPVFNYISFREYLKTHDANDGDIMLTYCVYNPDSNGEDDIIIRFDCPIGGENYAY